MKKVAIIYKSVHNKNTEKLLEEIQKDLPVDLYDASDAKDSDLSDYDIIGFASGIYNSDMHRSLFDYIEHYSLLARKAFIIYTSGTNNSRYADKFKKALSERGIEVSGVFRCKGHDNYLKIFKPIGGIAKGHPNQKDIQKAKAYVKNIIYTD